MKNCVVKIIAPLFLFFLNLPQSVQADASRVFVSDSTLSKIVRVNPDASNAATIISTASGLNGLSVDNVGRKLYWFEQNSNSIFSSNFDGSSKTTITTSVTRPQAIAVDGTNQLLFVIHSPGSQKAIIKMNLDGSSITTVVSKISGLGDYLELAVNPNTQRVYYIDQNMASASSVKFIGYLDSKDQGTLSLSSMSPASIDIDLTNAKVYWSESDLHRIQRANLDLGSPETFLTLISIFQPNGIALDPSGPTVYFTDSQQAGVFKYKAGDSASQTVLSASLPLSTPTTVALGFPAIISPDTTTVDAPEVSVDNDTDTVSFTFEEFSDISLNMGAFIKPFGTSAAILKALNTAQLKYVLTVTNQSTSQIKKKVTKNNKTSLKLPPGTYSASYNAKIGAAKLKGKTKAAKVKLTNKIKTQKKKEKTVAVKNKIQNLKSKLALAGQKTSHTTSESPSVGFTLE